MRGGAEKRSYNCRSYNKTFLTQNYLHLFLLTIIFVFVFYVYRLKNPRQNETFEGRTSMVVVVAKQKRENGIGTD